MKTKRSEKGPRANAVLSIAQPGWWSRCRSHVGFAALCLLAGSQWIANDAWPSSLSPLQAQSMHYAVLALLALAVIGARTFPTAVPLTQWLKVASAGLLLLGLPALLLEAAHTVATQSGTALFTLIPLCTCVGVAATHTSSTDPDAAASLMVPALLGLCGGVLLFPFHLPGSTLEALRFSLVLLAAVSVATAGVWLNDLLTAVDLPRSLAALTAPNALLLGMTAAWSDPVHIPRSVWPLELLRFFTLDLPSMLLLVWLLRELSPTRLSVRFLLVPLISVAEGLIVLHVGIDLRQGLGIVLLAGAVYALLLSNSGSKRKASSVLGLDR